MDFIEKFRDQQNKLTKSEIKLGNYIASHNREVIYDTLKALSDNTKTSDATVLRFCKKLGYDGFSDLKIKLAQESIGFNQNIKKGTYYHASASSLVNAINQTEKLINKKSLKKAVDLLIKARNIYLFGVGHSGESAKDYEKTWMRIGLITHAETDPHIQIQFATLLDKTDLVVGISLSGHTKDTFDSLKEAKKSGAKILTISNDLSSPISQLGDACLQTAVGEFANIGSVSGQVSQLYLCDVLARGYAKKAHIDSQKITERALKAVMGKSI